MITLPDLKQRPIVLVVDDEPEILVALTDLLEGAYHVLSASSGEQGLALLRENPDVAVIISDQRMPGMDGTETLQKMNEMEDNLSAGAPVIALTANALEGAKDEYISAGFKDYLSKPISIEEMEDILFYYIPPEKIRTISD